MAKCDTQKKLFAYRNSDVGCFANERARCSYDAFRREGRGSDIAAATSTHAGTKVLFIGMALAHPHVGVHMALSAPDLIRTPKLSKAQTP